MIMIQSVYDISNVVIYHRYTVLYCAIYRVFCYVLSAAVQDLVVRAT